MHGGNLQAGIVGATGYTGMELLRLLIPHPRVDIKVLTSRSGQGRPVADVFPGLPGGADLTFSAHDTPALRECDIVFFATPSATAMHKVPELLGAKVRVIDLSADFRLRDPGQWEHWYGVAHAAPELLKRAVYGLPEINRGEIASADLVANPGCYPTAVLLGLLPLLAGKQFKPGLLIADVKSGYSGAGRKAASKNLFSEASETFRAYNVANHRHLPEICQVLAGYAGQDLKLTFVPHLAPMVRGIFATLYIRSESSAAEVAGAYQNHYMHEPFVEIVDSSEKLDTGSVRGTNECRIAVNKADDTGLLIVSSVIDNLVKGAAGQALQNMNIMFDMDEKTGLDLLAVYP